MHLLAKPLRLMINQIYTYLSSITHRGDPRTDDIRPRDDETFLTSSQGRLHDDCRFQVKKKPSKFHQIPLYTFALYIDNSVFIFSVLKSVEQTRPFLVLYMYLTVKMTSNII